MGAPWLISLRALHILLAALWLGAAFLLTLFVMPAVRDTGRAGGQFMQMLHKHRLPSFMASVSVLAVFSGIWLYWFFTAGFRAPAMFSGGGLAFGIGGLCGLLTMILGGAVMGRGFAQMARMGEQIPGLRDSERTAHMQAMSDLRARLSVAGTFIRLLMIAALLLMSAGHYL